MKISVTQAAANIVAYRNAIGDPIPVPDSIFDRRSPGKKSFSNDMTKKNCKETTKK